MLQLIFKCSLVVFLLGILYRIIKIRRRISLRCELYPIPNSPRAILSIFLLNRKKMSLQQRHWLGTFLFHLGIFIHELWLILILLQLLLLFPQIYLILGASGLSLMLIFGLYLLIRKLRKPIRYYVPFEDYFILSLILFISATGFLALFEVDALHSSQVMLALFSFSEMPELGFFEALHIFSFSLLLLMLPFTRITHYIAVFFAHFLLWDKRNAEELEPKLSKILKNYKVKWEAEHLDPELSWKEEIKIFETRI